MTLSTLHSLLKCIFYSYKLSSAGNQSCIKMASHGSDRNKVYLLLSFPSFFFLCLFVWLSVCLPDKGHLLSFPSFFFRVCLCACLSVCLSNKGHLLMSFPSFFFLCLHGGRGGGGGTPILGQYVYVPPESSAFFGLGRF